jgi:hypothetical protein
LASLVTGANVFSTQAVATAGRLPLVCLDVPLMICNPAETAGNDKVSLSPGQQLLVKSAGNGSIAPGNWGLLCPPSGGCGASNISSFLENASSTGSQCTSNSFNTTKPGNTSSVTDAVNTRFDIWNGSAKGDSSTPDVNVTKGYNPQGSGANAWCNATPASTQGNGMGLPRDNCFASGSCSNSNRVGDGSWDRKTYYDVNHAPAPYTAALPSALASLTRYQTYLAEVNGTNGLAVPDPNPATGSTLENGAPQCHKSGARNRRLINIAVVNCNETNINGKTNTRPVSYFQGFMTEPANPDFYFEVVQTYSFTDPNGPIHSNVRLVR